MLKKRPKPESTIEIVPINEISFARSWVIYGRSGTGKTTLASSFPKPMLYLDVRDRGTDSIRDVKGIYVSSIQSFAQFEELYWCVDKERWPQPYMNIDYKTIVIDTVSQLQNIVIREFADKHQQRNGKLAGDWGSLRKQDWAVISSQMKQWIQNYIDLTEKKDIEVVLIAQDRVFNVEDEDDTSELPPPEVGPALSPSIAKTMNASVSVVANTFIRRRIIKNKATKKSVTRMEYCLGVGPSAIYTRKVRKPKSEELPELVVNPDYEKLIDLIKGETNGS